MPDLAQRSGAGVEPWHGDGRPFRQPRDGTSLRLALSRSEAAEALGISLDSFEPYVQPELRLVRRGRLRLIPVAELERWLDSNAARVLEEAR
jgi:excisionase family DNA binding protein